MLKRLYYILLQRLYVFRHRNRKSMGKVYMFHDISDEAGLYSIRKDEFIAFITYLKQHRKIVDLDTLVKEKDPDNVVITFDDAYETLYENAYPYLKEEQIPYHVFICNELLDKEGYLKKEEVGEMLKDSRCIPGSHGWRHVLSRFMKDGQLTEELLKSRKELSALFSYEIKEFAFPYGSMYACSKQNIADAENIFRHVCLTYALPYHEECRNVIPRINISSGTYEKEMR